MIAYMCIAGQFKRKTGAGPVGYISVEIYLHDIYLRAVYQQEYRQKNQVNAQKYTDTVTCNFLPHEFIHEPSAFFFFQHHGQIPHEQTLTICHIKSALHPSFQWCSPFPVDEKEV